ncbi:MAG: ATP-dependent RecD-like DNA helicase [Clostridiales bacterium]|nr:ATP-dependent RecD-like DNA helicase [Clostridiales bacterium]
MERLSGAVEEIRFRNDDNGYTVLVVEAEDGAPVIVVGNLPPVTPGDTLELEGEFTIHPKFGMQFKAVRASVSPPVGVYGIIKFLSSGLIEGCGEKTAARIVEKFGAKTVEIFEKTPERLAEVKGISPAKAKKMSESYAEQRHRRDAIMFLTGYGVSVNLALKLFEIYGAATVSTVKTNPYILVEDVDGVGFLTADRIARSLGIAENSLFRIRAGVLHSINSACEREGNTYLPREKLVDAASRLLSITDKAQIENAIETLRVERKLVVPFDGAVMGEMYYRTERAAAVKMVKRVDEAGLTVANVEGLIDRFEKINSITLHPAQREGVMNAVSHGVSVITGGPGTGKTTIINCILFILDALGSSALLLAPTGRAAKRITDGCGRDAFTIHRALLSLEDGEKFGENAVIVDEFSMVDIFLFRTLLEAVNDTARLIIVGDADQLPSVGAGNVLRDLIASGLVPVTRLSFIYRQSSLSRIAVSAHAINEGKLPELDARDGDFFFFPMRNAEATADMAVELATERITAKFGIDPSRIQVIAALKNGVAGVNALNARLQRALNCESKKKFDFGDITFCVGDRVMHTVNNYELEWTRGAYSGKGVFNGDIGTVAEIMATGEIEVEFEDGRRALYVGETRRQLILSYAITVHKSQGCEFDAIVMPIVGGAPVIMTRNLLYTAITRAKKLAVLVGEKYHVERMIANNYVAERFSALKEFIDEAKSDMRKLFS